MDAIAARGLGKRYRSYRGGRPGTLKETALRGFRGLRHERFWALRDVSFRVEHGKTLGLIGPNGAGKSTLLRLAASVEYPDAGAIQVHGRVGAILELGLGFHPELTGRENVVLAGLVAGMSRREVARRMEDIVDFAGLAGFIDSPLRTYSSGMWARLAFSVATHVDPEILLIDEALAVGDLAFQQRCLERIRDFRRAGTTIVIVSHDPGRIRDLCDEAIWLRNGSVIAQGDPTEVTLRYADSQAEETRRATPRDVPDVYTPAGVELRIHENRFGTQEAVISSVRVLDAWGSPTNRIHSGDAVRIEMEVAKPASVRDAQAGATLRRADGTVCLDLSSPVTSRDGVMRIRLDIERLDVARGEYAFDLGLYASDWAVTYDYHHAAYPLSVTGAPPQHGIMAPPATWSVEGGAGAPQAGV